MKASSVTDQHLSFALSLLEQPALSNEKLAKAYSRNMSQKALLHSSLVQCELAIHGVFVEFHAFQSTSASNIDRYFREKLYRTMTLGESFALLESLFDAANIRMVAFVEMFSLHKDQDSWLFCLERILVSLPYTKIEWKEKLDEGTSVLSDTVQFVEQSDLIASSGAEDFERHTQHWSEIDSGDLKSYLMDFRAWARAVRSNMDEY